MDLEGVSCDSDQAIDLEMCRVLVGLARRMHTPGGELRSVDEGRAIIDDLDEQIRQLITVRREVSRGVQVLRMRAGGERVDTAREQAIVDVYRTQLGSGGEHLARDVLAICRLASSLDV